MAVSASTWGVVSELLGSCLESTYCSNYDNGGTGCGVRAVYTIGTICCLRGID